MLSEENTREDIAANLVHQAEKRVAALDRRSMWADADQDFEGIRRLELLIPFAPGSVNVYLVPLADGGWILLDCGLDLPNVLPAYESAGFRWSDVRQIILTHVHPDHSGLSARIRELTGAPVRIHRHEQEVLNSLRDPESWMDWQDDVLHAAGVSPDARVSIRSATRVLRSYYSTLDADSYIEHDDVIATALGPMRALLTPGHSPGHLCFHFPEKKILLAGDHLLRSRSPHVEWYREGRALEEFRVSLKAMALLDVEWVLPAHGRAYRGHKDRIDSLLEHSLDMEERIHALVASVDSPHELAKAAWRVPLPPFEHRNAVFEVLAYMQQAPSSRVQ